ncbi:unnamed protein product [Brassica napus]|uniref:(rape) hypothetical protein n=1 Tax=Brassica napus TaxID=3708 RepID=A0A816JGM6_BRANA|nr:unnamed protein product [Brassica napus]
MSDNEETQNIAQNNILDYISTIDTNNFFEKDILIQGSKIKNLEKEAKITLKDDQDIHRNRLSEILKRKNVLYFGKFISEFPLPIESTRGEFTLPIILSEAINDKISKMKSSHQEKISYIHIGTIQIIVRSTFKKNIDSPIRLVVTDNRIQDENDRIIRIVDSNLKHSVVKFNVVCQYGIPLATKNLNNSIGIIYNFQRHDLMEDGDHPLSITYAVGYALSSSAHSIEFANKNDIYLENLFKETTTVKFVPKKNISDQINKTYTPQLKFLEPSSSSSRIAKSRTINERRKSISSSYELQQINQKLNKLERTITTLDNKL